MRTIHAGASDAELVECLSEWSDLMAAADFTGAAGFLHPPTPEHAGEVWTAESLRTYIANYGSWDPLADGRQMRVTSAQHAEGSGPELHVVYRVRDRLPYIELTLPLDGEWSDLTAMVNVVEQDGRWAFVLYDLHVL